ncbi:DUF378 domain-containing protein [Candidatus Nanohalovita haloferacivicina]|uniref:DUF378 domain-containing protein n=1 Tax=Candidatus Nanohalovita haloferacivicina TaxID=2978046 RepID=UPI00325FB35E|nr:DUF378 domain-containing protein [Candidatus Nanohalobia archaeon BNXNv]
MADVKYLDWSTLGLVVIGALNWGLVGLGMLSGEGREAYNVVNLIFGGVAGGQVEAAIYLLVGLAGLYQIYFGYELYEEK